MLASGQAQTEASWQNKSRTAISIHPKVRARHCSCLTSQDLSGTLCLTEHPAAAAIKESHNSSEGYDSLMPLCSNWPFGTDSNGPPGLSQSVKSDMGSLISWVVMHGCYSVLLVAECRLWTRCLARFTFLSLVRMLDSSTNLQDIDWEDCAVVLESSLQTTFMTCWSPFNCRTVIKWVSGANFGLRQGVDRMSRCYSRGYQQWCPSRLVKKCDITLQQGRLQLTQQQ